MKLSMVLFIGLFVLMGCQSFRYYDPQKPYRGKTQFYNNYDNSPKASFWKWQLERWTSSKPAEPPFEPEIIKTDLGYLQQNSQDITLTWVGHSTALLQLRGLNILIDPVFSERVSPVSFMGPKRLVGLPFTIKDLPKIDVVVVSHSHYDHLDLPSLRELGKKDPEVLFLVPLGDAELLQSEGIPHVQELDWWDEVKVQNLSFVFTPAQHWTQRWLFQRNQSLWGGWSIKTDGFHFVYTGDTGYSKDFADIHARRGDVDLAMIPVGAYEPRWFMGLQHVDPDGAVQIHQDLRSKHSIGVHWGTFRLSDEPMAEPPVELGRARKKAGLEDGAFHVMKHGEILKIEVKK
nr:MBL fold metallo-hydrolase [Bdellovibrio sp. HAGR004]